MKHKIRFPAGYQSEDLFDSNEDINIFLPDGSIYFGTAFTVLNIDNLMEKNRETWFWSTDMFIVKDMSRECIYLSAGEILEAGYMDQVFTRIGTIGINHFKMYTRYDSIINFGGVRLNKETLFISLLQSKDLGKLLNLF